MFIRFDELPVFLNFVSEESYGLIRVVFSPTNEPLYEYDLETGKYRFVLDRVKWDTVFKKFNDADLLPRYADLRFLPHLTCSGQVKNLDSLLRLLSPSRDSESFSHICADTNLFYKSFFTFHLSRKMSLDAFENLYLVLPETIMNEIVYRVNEEEQKKIKRNQELSNVFGFRLKGKATMRSRRARVAYAEQNIFKGRVVKPKAVVSHDLTHDMIIARTLEKYIQDNRVKVLFLSHDQDMTNYVVDSLNLHSHQIWFESPKNNQLSFQAFLQLLYKLTVDLVSIDLEGIAQLRIDTLNLDNVRWENRELDIQFFDSKLQQEFKKEILTLRDILSLL